tara:strand:+ start:26 stop:1066 length:1041 start_codon:yes stop_codon:yes gene_type:complete
MAYTTIDKPTDYFNTVLFTGNGGSQTITGVGFQADFIWFKERSSAGEHKLNNSVLGTNNYLISNSTSGDDTTGSGIQSYNSDGYAISNASNINDSGETYVTWNWLAGGSTASSNSNGSITSSVSANTTAGFSIVSYTGTGSNATVGHGLGSAPDMYIIKRRSATEHWQVYHSGNTSAPQTDYLQLSTTEATVDDVVRWNDTAPTSSVFSLGTHASVNGSSDTYIAYCFHNVKGYLKCGSYKGNGNANDGTFVYTGFAPAWVMIKRTDSTSQWCIIDNKRPGYNIAVNTLFANLSDQEATDLGVNLLSNGFKEDTTNNLGASGGTYIYMAFAESPFVNSKGVPNNAK